MGLTKPIAYEQGDHLYLVSPVAPSTPSAQQIEELAWGQSVVDQLRGKAPNDSIAWFGGHYVSADQPNMNGAMWLSQTLAMAEFTPVFMPVTVMHDFRTAVGLIADVALRTPEKDGVPRTKMETALALWKHRFPDVVAEAEHNYEQGSLMQSMECLAPRYDCGECGMSFHKLPGGLERENWCEHLAGESATAVRILRDVTFTGTGLIFGGRGAEGADPEAHLESFTQEVAEFHTKAHRETARSARSTRTRSKTEMEIEKSEYDELVARPSKEEHQAALDAKTAAERKAEEAEIAKKAAEDAKTAAEAKVTAAEEKANQATLRDERVGKLGEGFLAKLPDTVKETLKAQASTLEDAAWASRLDELAALTGVAHDAKKDGKKEDEQTGVFSAEEIAAAAAARQQSPEGGKSATPTERRSVVAGL